MKGVLIHSQSVPIPVVVRFMCLSRFCFQWRSVWRVRLRPFVCWDCRFEHRPGHGCLSVVSVVICQIYFSASEWSLVQRSPTECGVSECDLEALIMSRPWPTGAVELWKKYIEQDRLCTYNETLRRVRATTIAVKSNKYYIFWLCVCSLKNPASSAHAPYFYLWHVLLYSISPHSVIYGTILRERIYST